MAGIQIKSHLGATRNWAGNALVGTNIWLLLHIDALAKVDAHIALATKY
jgi:hypothetical protein